MALTLYQHDMLKLIERSHKPKLFESRPMPIKVELTENKIVKVIQGKVKVNPLLAQELTEAAQEVFEERAEKLGDEAERKLKQTGNPASLILIKKGRYEAVVRPGFWFLRFTRRSRVFQRQDAVAIVKTMLQAASAITINREAAPSTRSSPTPCCRRSRSSTSAARRAARRSNGCAWASPTVTSATSSTDGAIARVGDHPDGHLHEGRGPELGCARRSENAPVRIRPGRGHVTALRAARPTDQQQEHPRHREDDRRRVGDQADPARRHGASSQWAHRLCRAGRLASHAWLPL
jgi:hypothetical protein